MSDRRRSRVEIPAAFHDAGRFREELRDASQLRGIICDDGHLAQLPKRPILITGLTAVIAIRFMRTDCPISNVPGEPSRYTKAARTGGRYARTLMPLAGTRQSPELRA